MIDHINSVDVRAYLEASQSLIASVVPHRTHAVAPFTLVDAVPPLAGCVLGDFLGRTLHLSFSGPCQPSSTDHLALFSILCLLRAPL